MKRLTVLAMLVAGLCGCGAPSLYSLQGPESGVRDPGLVGEWRTEGATQTRAVIREGDGGRYDAAMTVHQNGQFKAALAMEVTITEIASVRYLDLFLARSEREKLSGCYGFLVVPVHQVMRMERQGDVLKLWSLDSDWARNVGAAEGFACEPLPVGGGAVPVITAGSGALRKFLEKHADDAGAFAAPMEFRRAGG
ncbi:hypothetical protein PHYC_01945 [Phycisphaerales bacterium]|nr:hypothetical protein PHYC_01945 [Phycisphaerales bacterium]